VNDGTRFDRSLDGFFKRVVLTAMVLVRRGGTGIPIAAAFSGGSSSSGAAWKCASGNGRKPVRFRLATLLTVVVR
jgi:hypothetical protein